MNLAPLYRPERGSFWEDVDDFVFSMAGLWTAGFLLTLVSAAIALLAR